MDPLTRQDVLGLRVRAQQLDRPPSFADAAVLDIGVQDTGPDGARWALAVRGVQAEPDQVVMLWTVRGAPHLYRRDDLPSVLAAVAPFSDADAGKRIYDAARSLKAAGIGNLEGLDTVAEVLRRTVTSPTVKGDASGQITALLPEPYLRDCRPCGATHVHEMTFRLGALRAGLALQPGTSPPVLEPLPPVDPLAEPLPRHDLVRGCLRLLGPTTPQHVAGYLDAPLVDVRRRWPGDTVEVRVGDRPAWLLEESLPLVGAAHDVVRLLGPYDLYLQGRDRDLLVSDPARAKALWPVLGRPGAVLLDGEVAGLWRPRQTGNRLRLLVEPWVRVTRALRSGVEQQAQLLADSRGVGLSGVEGL